jgi:hypothetical protein
MKSINLKRSFFAEGQECSSSPCGQPGPSPPPPVPRHALPPLPCPSGQGEGNSHTLSHLTVSLRWNNWWRILGGGVLGNLCWIHLQTLKWIWKGSSAVWGTRSSRNHSILGNPPSRFCKSPDQTLAQRPAVSWLVLLPWQTLNRSHLWKEHLGSQWGREAGLQQCEVGGPTASRLRVENEVKWDQATKPQDPPPMTTSSSSAPPP